MSLARYARLYRQLVIFSFAKAMEFRVDFWTRILMDIVYYFVMIAFFKILFLNTTNLAGWNEGQVIIFISGYFLIDALYMTLNSGNVYMLMRQVNEGTLDYHLVRPVSTLFFVLYRELSASSCMNAIIAAGISAWAILSYPAPFGMPHVAGYYLLLLVGYGIYLGIRVWAVVPVFWLHSGRGTDQIFYSLAHTAERPDRIYRGWVRSFLTIAVPFAVIVSFPARFLFSEEAVEVALHMVLALIAVWGVALLLWKKALGVYSSASS